MLQSTLHESWQYALGTHYVPPCLLAYIITLTYVETTKKNIDDMRGKEIIQTILIALFLFVTQTAWAQLEVGETYSDKKFRYKCLSDGTVEIIEYIGTDTEVTLPYYILVGKETGYGYASHTVSSLAAGVFEGNTTITSVSMANCPENIGNHAFYGCTNLKSVQLPTHLTSFGSEVFAYCNSLETISLYNQKGIGETPLGVENGILYFTDELGAPTEILACAPLGLVDGSGDISSRSYVTKINAGAFEGCTTLTSLTYGYVEEIGFNAFKDCTNLTQTCGYDKIKTLGEGCYQNCTNLGDAYTITEMSKLTEIPDRAFYNCINLKRVGYFTKITSIGAQAFENCEKLEKIYFQKMLSLKTIGNKAFKNCTSLCLSSDEFPMTLEMIGNSAFRNCQDLCLGYGSIKFASGSMLKSIEANAFRGCCYISQYHFSRLNFEFPEGLEYIGILALAESEFSTDDSEQGKEIYIPKTVKTICEGAFSDAAGIFNVDETNQYYKDIDGVLYDINATRLCSFPKRKGGDVGYIIEPSVSKIDSDAFYRSSLPHVVLPSNLTYISSGTFANSQIKDITIPATVTAIGKGAFYNCTKLKNIFFMPKTPPAFGSISVYTVLYTETGDGTDERSTHPFVGMSDCALHTQCYIGTKYEYVANETNPQSFYDWKYKQLGVVNTDTETGRPFTSVSYDFYFTMPESGYMTVARDFDIKFHDESAGELTPYAVSAFDPTTGTVTLTKFVVNHPQLESGKSERHVPARLLDNDGYYHSYYGVIVKGTPGKKYRYILTRNDYTTAAEERMSLPSTYKNLVYPNLVETYREPEYQNTYKFVLNGGKIRRVTKAGILGYNKAYLRLSKLQVEQMYANGLGAKGLNVVFEDGETTTIEYAKTIIASKEDNKYYNLSGQCVENPTKGIYIKNGKKIVIK